jgi:hypothetical protein
VIRGVRSPVGSVVRASAWWGVLVLGIVAALPAAAAEPRADSVELWYVSTRSLDERDLDAPTPSVYRSDGNGGWSASTLEAVADAGATPIVLLVHGNRADADTSVEFASPVYEQLRELGGRCRLVIWSWPADQVRGGPRHDVAVKVARTDLESVLLARFVQRIPPAGRVGMIGYSLGSRIIGGALHLLHGEPYAGRTLPSKTPGPRTPMRIVLTAGAMDQDSLCTAEGDAPKWSDVQRILVTENHTDRVLRWYPRMRRGRRGPAALGFAGPACCNLPPEQIESVDLTCEIGNQHAWKFYSAAPSLRERLPWYAFVD